ncbi:recombinase family protein [Cereibacter sediminicola]|uniref:recombinase family protein n=1 Tax=Cereibacter sediminicola TaxID=2584941 RepID=UPI0011A02740|nr:recombinase family protein [Cereibacter sediminicola]
MSKGNRVAIYARFSTDLQREASIEDQLVSCREAAERQGWQVVAEYSDRATSGASMFRSGIEALQRGAKAGQFDIVLSEGMDRLSRKLSDISRFHERMEHAGIRIWTITEEDVDDMKIGLKGTMNAMQLRDIALKTRRGQRGRVRQGKVAGGNSYGYDVVAGPADGKGRTEGGERAINPAEAEVVRRIYEDYARGLSPRRIAEALNIEGIPGPRGGAWGASTLHGNRERGTGILNNELYAGRLVWNRLHYSKDPDTGKRMSRPNAGEVLVTTDVPHLRIVDNDLWQRVRARQGALASKGTQIAVWDRRRPKFLFSRLMKCGCCGSGVSKEGRDGFSCSAARSKGTAVCRSRTVIKQADLEGRVLHALEHHLMDEEAVRIFCEEYAAERNRLAAGASASRKGLEKELGQVKRDHGKLVDAIIAGVPVEQVKDRMNALDARRQELERQLASKEEAPGPLRFHPSMAGAYHARIGTLIRALQEPEGMEEAKEAIRALVEKIVLTPVMGPDGKTELAIDLHGALASLLRLATGLPMADVPRRAAGGANSVTASDGVSEAVDIIDKSVLVAGAGFEPAAFRL